MPLTLTDVSTGFIGDLKYRVMDIAFDTSYPTGGESLTPADLGLDSIFYLRASAPAGYKLVYDYSAQTLMAFRVGIAATAAGDIVADGDNQIVVDAAGTGFEVSGAGAAFQAALAQVTNATDLSTDLALATILVIGR